MLVKHYMSRNVVTIDADDSMQHAASLMKEHKLSMLPVMNRGELVGIITDGDLKRASASDATTLDVHEILYLIAKIKIKDIMTKTPITVHPDCTTEEAAQILMDKKISGVPVVDSAEEIVGIITKDDLFRVLISVSALGKQGVQFAFIVEDRSGSIKELTDVIRNHEGRIASILSSYERAPAGHRIVYIRTYDIPPNVLPLLKEEMREKATLVYVVDHRTNEREIYRDLIDA